MWCLRPWVVPLVLALTGLLVVYIAWGSMYTPEALWAPGHLSRHHADLLECHLCHKAFHGTANDNCLACHSTKVFQARSEVAVTEFHQAVIQRQQSCIDCHTEHRGVLAGITMGMTLNPHGEIIFRVTGASSCSDCHRMNSGKETARPTLLQNATVRHLIEAGEGSHQPGRFAKCLRCHVGGQREVKEDDG